MKAGKIVTTVEHHVHCAIEQCGSWRRLHADTDLLRENEACKSGWVLMHRGWVCAPCHRALEKSR